MSATNIYDKSSPRPVGVMHIIDTLSAAGAERVAVNMVNALPRDRYVTHLCTTRADGPLESSVASDVKRLRLNRRFSLDLSAIARLRHYIRENDIQIVHAHSSALFITRLATVALTTRVIWHAHYGRYASEDQRAWRYRVATAGIAGVITVNKDMAAWCCRRLSMPSDSVWYLPNPVAFPKRQPEPAADVPGTKGSRIVCVANFRPEKDHRTLLRAMALVIGRVPSAQLILVGKTNDQAYRNSIENEIIRLGLTDNVLILGERSDIPAILSGCDIGVLSSSSEGLPMSLLEYGVAGLPAVATDVGQCGDVLDGGRAGYLVPAASASELAEAFLGLLTSEAKRRDLAETFRKRVKEKFSSDTVLTQVCRIYDEVLAVAPQNLSTSKEVAVS
jgi:glycosyltransferase involved in cell wall biosynthesis